MERNKLLFKKTWINEGFHISKDDLIDEADMTSTEIETAMHIRLRNREALLLKKIEAALQRIAHGTFGECQSCGDEIEMKRLEVRPMTTYCMPCKEEQEHQERIHIDGHQFKSLGAKLRLVTYL